MSRVFLYACFRSTLPLYITAVNVPIIAVFGKIARFPIVWDALDIGFLVVVREVWGG